MDSFSTTIFPYSKESFFSTFWEKKYCHISSDQNPDLLNFLNTLFSYDEADRILTTERNRIHESIRVSKDGLTIPQENLYNNEGCGIVNYDIRKILNLYNDGATIILNRVHQDNKLLKEFCQNLSNCLNARVGANTYLTPPNSNGFHVHADLHDVILLQIAGEKRWKLQKENEYLTSPRVPNNSSVPTDTSNWTELTLRKGEALYIPRGIMHEGIATASHSLHLTIGIHPYTWFNLLQDSLGELEKKNDLLRKSATTSLLDFNKTLAEVSSTVSTFLLNTDEIKQDMLKRVHQANTENLLRGKLKRMAEPQFITLDSVLALRSTQDVSILKKDSEVELRFGRKALLLPLFTADVLELILEGKSFKPSQIANSLDDKSKLVLVQRLYHEGVLEVF